MQPAIANRVPEEILRDILKYSTSVSLVDIFMKLNTRVMDPPSSARAGLLLVCKRWLRVGTPLVYETVVLDCEDKIRKLARTLRHNPILGSMVRNLRVDGGYGLPFWMVAKLFSKVCVFAINIKTLSKSYNSGLSRALQHFDPTELYVHGFGEKDKTKKSKANSKYIIDAISGWKSLVSCLNCRVFDS